MTRSEQWGLFNERKGALFNKAGNPWSRETDPVTGETDYQIAPMQNSRNRYSSGRRFQGTSYVGGIWTPYNRNPDKLMAGTTFDYVGTTYLQSVPEYEVWNAYGNLAADPTLTSPQDSIGVQSYYRLAGFDTEDKYLTSIARWTIAFFVQMRLVGTEWMPSRLMGGSELTSILATFL